jgi:putative hydrolase of the HAD superfamily
MANAGYEFVVGSGLIRGILLDSGDTLVRPIGGEWLPGRAFRALVAARGLNALEWSRLDRALRVGMAYLEANHHLTTEEEECGQFQVFCEQILQELGHSAPAQELAREIATAMVYETGIESFPDTIPMLERWQSRGLRLGIISNCWPSLDRHYRALGLRDYFDPFVMSAQVGCIKPNPRIFRLALDRLGLPPAEVLFVDDGPENVVAARALGLHGVVLSRGGQPPAEHLPWVTSLEELDAFLDPADAS